jgi:hypothetical protein
MSAGAAARRRACRPLRPFISLGNGLANVADAKPTDTDFNCGRWQVYAVTWNVTPWQMTNDGEVLAAAQAGDISISANPVKEFFCHVAIVPPSWN